jgi:TPR repeat protein
MIIVILLVAILPACNSEQATKQKAAYIFSTSDPAGDITDKAVSLARNKKTAEAVVLFTQAAEQGNRAAQYFLGLMYARGDGLEQDFHQAYKWLLKAGMGGHPKAMYHLGVMFVNGDGVEEDVVRAQEWFWLGATAGDRYSEKRLRAITPRLSADEIAIAAKQSKALWQKIPHDLKVERFSMH